MRSLIYGIMLFAMLALMFASQTMNDNFRENNITFNIYNFTENNLVWNYTNAEDTIKNNISEMYGIDYGNIQSKRIKNLIHKLVDFIGYSMFELSKWVIEFGYTHPEYNFEYYMQFVKYWLFAMIVISIFPILIPIMALIYLLFNTIKKAINKISIMLRKQDV